MPGEKTLIAREATISIQDTTTIAWTLQQLGAGSAQECDEFAWPSRAHRYMWHFDLQYGPHPVLLEHCDLYLSWSDGTTRDGGALLTGADAGVSTDVLPALHPLGQIVTTTATASTLQAGSGEFTCPTTHGIFVLHNNSADSLRNVADTCILKVTAFPDELQ